MAVKADVREKRTNRVEPDQTPPRIGKGTCSTVLETLKKALELLTDVITLSDDCNNKKEKAEFLIEGLISGLQLGVAEGLVHTSETTQNTSEKGASLSNPDPKTRWSTVVKKGAPDFQSMESKSSADIRKSMKMEAKKKLVEQTGCHFDPARQVIMEPEMQNYRKITITDPEFRNAIEAFLQRELGIADGVQYCRRLERGGFKLQFTSGAFEKLKNIDMKIVTRRLGTWTKADSVSIADNPSIVAEGIDVEVSEELILDELAGKNCVIHGKKPKEARRLISKIERLKRKDHKSGSLTPTRSVRIFGNATFLDDILSQGGFFICGQPCYCRPYSRPVYKCYQCQRNGHHRAAECRFPHKCRYCSGNHLSSECTKEPNSRTEDDNIHCNREARGEEERRRKTPIKGNPAGLCQNKE